MKEDDQMGLSVLNESESEMEGWDMVAVDNCEDYRDFRAGTNGGSWTIEDDEESDVDLDMLVAVWF